MLLAPENLTDGIEEPEDATPILDYAQQNYETVVIDCGNPYGNWNLSIARFCDELLLVTTNELAALEATQRALKYFESARIAESKIRVVINRYEREAGLNAENIAMALQTEILQVIPSDYDSVQKSLMEGKAIPSNSPFGKNMHSLAAKLIGGEGKAALNERKASSFSGLLSMFSRASS
ncbi:MAG: AAA family ATPase [Bryobacteraceae bacterium]